MRLPAGDLPAPLQCAKVRQSAALPSSDRSGCTPNQCCSQPGAAVADSAFGCVTVPLLYVATRMRSSGIVVPQRSFCLQDRVSGGCGRPHGRRVPGQRGVQPGAAVGGGPAGRLCLRLPLERDAAARQRALRHAQLRIPVLPAAVCDHLRHLRLCHQAGESKRRHLLPTALAKILQPLAQELCCTCWINLAASCVLYCSIGGACMVM